MTESSRAPDVAISVLDPAEDAAAFEEVVQLADQNRGTLGFLPRSALASESRLGHIRIAKRDRHVIGYLLFGIAQERIRLTHLCVAPSARGQGVAKALISHLSQTHPTARGIGLKCRRDYGLEEMWLHLGFTPLVDVEGRSKAGHLLTLWWLDHGHDDLFSQTLGSEGRLTASFGLDVFTDIHLGEAKDPLARQSILLAKSQERAKIDFFTTSQLWIELNRRKDDAVRVQLKSAARTYVNRQTTPDAVEELAEQLFSACESASVPARRKSAIDVRMLAAASLAQADLFISRDTNLVERIAPAVEDLIDVRVLTPSEAITYLDENYSERFYYPQRLLDTEFIERRMNAGDEREAVQKFTDPHSTDDLQASLVELASSEHGERRVVRNPQDAVIALYGYASLNEILKVPVLRVEEGDLSHTVSYQLLRALRETCLARGCRLLAITDRHLGTSLEQILEQDGFRRTKDGWTVPVIREILTWAELRAASTDLGAVAMTEIATTYLTQDIEIPRTVASRLEHDWWPLKIRGSGLKTYIVPIKPGFAQTLLGTRPSLLPRPDALGLSREHVYYRSPRVRIERPARVLWYESSEVGAITAASRLISVDRNRPAVLHSKYAHLGVWGLNDIVKAAGNKGEAMALRVADTEIFSRPINYPEIWSLLPDCRPSTLQSTQEINEQGFLALYERGIGVGSRRGSAPS